MASFDEAVPPGQAGKINATLHTTNYRGQVVKTIAVTTNDPAQASITLTLKVRVVGSVELLPVPSIAVSVAGPESRPGRLIVRKDASETGTLALANVKGSLPWLGVTVRKVEAAEALVEGLPEARPGDFMVEVRPSGDAPSTGAFQGTLAFDTGLTREPQVTVPLYAYVKPPITVSPQQLALQPGVDGIVLIALREDVDLDGVTATAQPAAFKASLERTNARTMRMKVTVDESAGPAPPTGSVTIRAGGQTVEVSVRVQR